ncbi:hypothetical protein GQ607_015912, partial [Colletotrichum asianum]
GYLNIKRSVHYSPYNLLAIKRYIIEVLTILTLDTKAILAAKEKRK